LNRDTGANRVPNRATLNQLGLEAMLVEGGGQREASNSTTDNQDTFTVSHLSLLFSPLSRGEV
jgi:hypothetical protein